MQKLILSLSLWLSIAAITRAEITGTVTKVGEKGFLLQTTRGEKSFVFGDHLLTGLPNPRGAEVDLFYRLRPPEIMEGMIVHVDYGIEAGRWTCRGVDPQCAEVWLGGVDRLKTDFTIIIKAIAKEGESIEKRYVFKVGTEHDMVLSEMLKSFQKPLTGKEFWAVYTNEANNKLQIQGFIKDDKFFIVEKLEVSCPEMKADKQPPFRLPNKNWNRLPSEDR